MWIFSRPLERLEEGDLTALIGVREYQVLEFKEQMYERRDPEAKRQLLRDVSALANAEGGVLIIGLAEDGNGVATAIVPVPDAEAEARRLVSACLTGLYERVPGLRTQLVPVRGGYCIVVMIPRSYRKPHMVVADNAHELWIRHDRQRSEMSVGEIRNAVLATEELEMKLERYLDDHCNRIRADAGSALRLGITATPLSIETGRIDINSLDLKRLLQMIDSTARRARGVLLTRGYVGTPTLEGRRVDIGDSSLHVFRTGHVEFIVSTGRMLLWPPAGLPKPSDASPTMIYDAVILTFLCRVYDFVRELRDMASITDPFAFTLNVWNCRGLSLSRGSATWPEDHLILPPVMVDPDEMTDVGLRRIADLFWNAFGVERAPFFDAEGKLEPFQ
jgi:hypothetical protein